MKIYPIGKRIADQQQGTFVEHAYCKEGYHWEKVGMKSFQKILIGAISKGNLRKACFEDLSLWQPYRNLHLKRTFKNIKAVQNM